MTTGGESYESMLNGLHFERTDKNVNDLSIDIKGGLGIFTLGYLDSHFSSYGR